MKITEIYASIQGETQYAGLPCTLVRTTGCDLRCGYCDSAFAFQGGREMTLDDITREVDRLGAPLVLLTGGEPMLQERELIPLMERLLTQGYTLMIETSGERPLGNVPKDVHKIVDVKCPDSGEADTFLGSNLDVLTAQDEVKFVISTRRDYEFAREFTKEHGLGERVNAVLFSPVVADPQGKWEALEPRTMVEWILADGLPVRLGLQLHKFVWHPATKGV